MKHYKAHFALAALAFTLLTIENSYAAILGAPAAPERKSPQMDGEIQKIDLKKDFSLAVGETLGADKLKKLQQVVNEAFKEGKSIIVSKPGEFYFIAPPLISGRFDTNISLDNNNTVTKIVDLKR